MNIDSLHVPRQYDRRIKLDDSDIEKIKKLRTDDPRTWSYRALGREFGVSHSMILLICRPDIAAKKKTQFKERRKDGRYYNKDKWREQMRRHRAHKKEVGV